MRSLLQTIIDRALALNNYLAARFRPMPMAITLQTLADEVRTPLGKLLLKYEGEAVDEALSCLFGYHLMEASVFDAVSLTSCSKIHHQFRLSPCLTRRQPLQGLAEFDQLPLSAQSLDVVLLHHVLEYSENPHQVLREAERVIIPRGYVVIVGFNPCSWIGLTKWIAQFCSNRGLWRRHSLRLGRVLDWLRLLNLEPVSVQQGFYHFPIDHDRLLQKTAFLERLGRKLKLPFGGFYVIVARKEVAAMIPIKPTWDRFNPVAGLVIGAPSRQLSDSVGQTRASNNQSELSKTKESFVEAR